MRDEGDICCCLLYFIIFISSKVAHCFLHCGQIGKRSRELLQNLLKINDFSLVNQADEQGLALIRKAAEGRDFCHTVVQIFHNRLLEFLWLVSNDFKFYSFLKALEHNIADLTGNEAIHQAENDRLKLKIIDEVRNRSYDSIKCEQNPEHIHLGTAILDPRCNQVRAACAAVSAHYNTVAKTADDAACKRAQNQARAVFRYVNEFAQIDLIENQQKAGE